MMKRLAGKPYTVEHHSFNCSTPQIVLYFALGATQHVDEAVHELIPGRQDLLQKIGDDDAMQILKNLEKKVCCGLWD